MNKAEQFEDVLAWKAARDQCKAIHAVMQPMSWHESVYIKDQIHRASGSVMDNIAEGYGRGKNGEFIYFLSIAQGSCSEVKSQIYRLFDFELIDESTFSELTSLNQRTSELIGGFIRYIKSSKLKGSRKNHLG